MLSLAWGPPVPRQRPQKTATSDDSSDDDDDEDEWEDSWLVTGGSDSSLRKWDIATGRPIERMGVDKSRGERTLVWTVGVLGCVFTFSMVGVLIDEIKLGMEQLFLATRWAW